MPNPFEIAKSLNEKTNLDYEISEYDPWMINRIMANHKDTVFFADVMNRFYTLPKNIQRDWYKFAAPKGRRFSEWPKSSINTDIDLMVEHYQCNRTLAEKYLLLLSDADLLLLKTKRDKGGTHGSRDKNKSKNP